MEEQNLYPLKFKPIYKTKIWGGDKFKTMLGKEDVPTSTCGESWEISAVDDNCSVVADGFLKGNTLPELVEMYLDDLVGEKVYERCGTEFPLLVKFLDVNDLLSIQVHPNDELALKRHDSLGKTELWYIVAAEPGAQLTIGFNRDIDRDTFIEYVVTGKLLELLNQQVAHPDEVYFIPAGRIHSSGKGLLIAEIQQSSDVTYRISDWGRVESDGIPRELHVDQSLDALDYRALDDYKTPYKNVLNETVKIESCQYFTVNVLEFDAITSKDYAGLGSFVVYMCLEGNVEIQYNGGTVAMSKGETVLVPAAIETLKLKPESRAKILEVYV